MAFNNDTLKMIDLPHAFQEVVNFAPLASATGACMDDDGERYIYMLLSLTSFWRYDTWHNTYQQLANPTGTFGAGTCMRYTKMFGTQLNGKVYGSIFTIISSGTGAPVFTRYDIANNTWNVLNVTSFAATFGTDGAIIFPTPAVNGFDGAYHSGVTRTITATALANINATSISVSALPQALASGTILNFGTYASPIWAVLTAGASASATSITVAPLQIAVTNSSIAYWYDSMYVVGNAATQMYRFQLSTSTWSTTSANSGTPALPAVTLAVGAGVGFRWVPGVAGFTDKLICIRGAGTFLVYAYDLVANTWSTINYTPNTEVFSTGTSSGVASDIVTGKANRLLISSNNFQNLNIRILELDLIKARMDMVTTLIIYPNGAAVVGDKMTVLQNPDGLQVVYHLLHTSNALVRDASLSLI